jgi:hypothetical protein
MRERRKENRRKKMVRNLYSYINRRDLFRKGRRRNEDEYRTGVDWFEREENKSR